MKVDDKIIARAAETLKTKREKKGLTQTDVASKLDIGLRQYQKIEKGQFPKFKTDQIKKLDELFGSNIYELLYDHDMNTYGTLTPDGDQNVSMAEMEAIFSKRELKKELNFNNSEETRIELLSINKIFAKAHKDLTEAHLKAINNVSDLIKVFDGKNSTVDDIQKSQKEDHTRLTVIESLIIQLGLRLDLWKTELGGIHKIDKLVADATERQMHKENVEDPQHK